MKQEDVMKSLILDTEILKTINKSLAKDVLIVFSSSIFLSVIAKTAIYLPFTPVPIVLQNSFAIFLGILLGPKKAFLAVIAFIIYGMFGFNVFAGGSAFNVLSPQMGYLAGYVVGAVIAGKIYYKSSKSPVNAFIALLAGHACVLLTGGVYLSLFVGLKNAVFLGIAPFIIGDFIKSVILTKAKFLG
jgi:biotin transport system substrate-specific component